MPLAELENSPWELVKYVLPQHADHAGVMWHGVYISWLEEARIDAIHKVGSSYSDLSEQGFEMPLISLKINYLQSIRHGERVLLKSWVCPRKLARLPWVTRFFLNDGILAAEAKVDLVLVKNSGAGMNLIRKYPKEISNIIEKLELGP